MFKKKGGRKKKSPHCTEVLCYAAEGKATVSKLPQTHENLRDLNMTPEWLSNTGNSGRADSDKLPGCLMSNWWEKD